MRQFIYSNDLAKIIVLLLNEIQYNESLIISPDSSHEISIQKISQLIANEFNYIDKLRYDTSKNDGQYRKTVDNTKFKKHYHNFEFINIENGIKETVQWFQNNYNTCRK